MWRFVPFYERGFIAVAGDNPEEFLQGLVTQDLRQLTPEVPLLYSALLSPQGKYLYDFFIWRDAGRVLLELEAERAPELAALLRKYTLRRNIAFETFTGDVFQIFNTDVTSQRTLGSMDPKSSLGCDVFADPRHKDLGYRARAKPDCGETTMDVWTTHRLRYNVPDCANDLRVGLSSPFEGNIDLLHGISFDKGCYMGQELVSRIHHRGLVKRRFPDL